MKRFRIILLALLTVVFTTQCTSKISNEEIKENANQKLSITLKNGNTVFVSNIYKDKELGEIYLKKDNDQLLKISDGKQHISCLLLNKKKNEIIYSQSQRASKVPKPLEAIIINAPSRFSDYKIIAYNIDTNTSTTLLDLSKKKIIGTISNMSFLNGGNILAFQTNYGKIHLLNLNKNNEIKAFKPEHQFMFDDFYNLKTDGQNTLTFDTASGYKSESDQTYVYNTFKYDVKNNMLEQITNNPYYNAKEVSGNRIQNKKWLLQEFNGKQLDTTSDKYFIIFNSDKNCIFTKVGCNNIMSSYKIDKNSLTINEMTSTRMACQNEIINEDDYISKIEVVTTFSIDNSGNTLTLKGTNNDTIAVYSFLK